MHQKSNPQNSESSFRTEGLEHSACPGRAQDSESEGMVQILVLLCMDWLTLANHSFPWSSAFSSVNWDSLPTLSSSQGSSQGQNEVTQKSLCDQHEWRLREQALSGIRQTLVQILVLLTSCMTLNKLLICSESQVPHEGKEAVNNTFSRRVVLRI